MPDLRGHGDSDAVGPFSVESWAEDCVAVLDRFELDTVDLVGGSLGGPIGVVLAATQPDRVRSLVAFGSTLRIAGEGLDEVLDVLRAKGVARMFADVIPELSVAPGTPESVIARILDETNTNSVEIVSEIWRATLATDVLAMASQVRCPCLVVSGTEDRTCPLDQGVEMARRLRGQHQALIGTGHLPMYESPDAAAKAVSDFTRTLPRR